ncbi:hypothetical protein Q5530_06065 [Saccharothrix sp. BKS2]|uniref:hypothetical protein n=1 Tax=Saccharothrix sp. BKS2 TaxID=3064400 RepID=UPI0039E76F4D
MRVVRRVPFTTAVVVVMIVVGVVSGALWTAAEDQSWWPEVAYGVPSLAAGRWWTLLTGPFLAIAPWAYGFMVGSFALFAGWCEWRLGTRFTAWYVPVTQLGSVLVAAGLLAAAGATGWEWASRTTATLDVGFSAGSMAAVAMLTALAPPPWRLRLRVALALYVVTSLLFEGTLADVEHLVAVLAGFAAGPWADRRFGGPPSRPVAVRERVALLAGVVVLLAGAGPVLGAVLPSPGPLGDTGVVVWPQVVVAAVAVPLVAGLFRSAG